MYEFAVVALLALATVKVVDFLSDNVPLVERFRSLLTFIVAVGATVWLDYSLFQGWDVAIRNENPRHLDHRVRRRRPDRSVAGRLRLAHP